MGVLIRASPKPVSPVTIPASNAAKRATSNAALNKEGFLARSLIPESAQYACVEALPGLHLGREVAHPCLLVLAGGVEGGVVRKSRFLGHRLEDVLALLDAAAMDHGEDGVRPVFVGRSLVAVGDGLVVGEGVAHLVDALVRHSPDPHRVGPEAGLAVVEDRREAAHDLAVTQVVGSLQELLVGEADLPSPQVERTRRQGDILLEGPDGGLIVFRDVPVGTLPVGLAVLGRLFLGRSAGIHIQGHPDLEELQGGQNAGLLGAAYAVQHVDGAFESQAGVGRDGHGIPEVELVVALVVVGDAGVGVYSLGAFAQPVCLDPGGDQARLVAEDARVEDGADLAYHPPPLERLYAPDHLVARDAQLAPDGLERLPLQRDLALDPVEYLPVGAVHHATAGSCADHALRALLDDFLLQICTIAGTGKTRYENVYVVSSSTSRAARSSPASLLSRFHSLLVLGVDVLDVFPDQALGVVQVVATLPEDVGGMEGRHRFDAVYLVPRAAVLGDPEVLVYDRLRGGAAETEDDLRLDGLDLALQVGVAGPYLRGLRLAVAHPFALLHGGPALHYVRQVDLF